MKKRMLAGILLLVMALMAFPLSALAAEDPGFPRETDGDFSRYDGKLIGVSAGTVQEVYLKEKIPNAKPVYYGSAAELTVALKSNKIDGYIAPYLLVVQMMKEDPALTYDPSQFGNDRVGFIFSKGPKTAVLRQQLNEYIARITEDGTMQQLVDHFLSAGETDMQPVDFSDLTGENGMIRYGTTNELMPFCYVGNGGLTGLDLVMLHDFFREYGYRCQVEATAFTSVLAGVSTGTYDMGGGGIVHTKERAETVDFSDSYMGSPQVMVLYRQHKGAGFLESIQTSFRKTFVDESRWKLLAKGLGTTLVITVCSFAAGITLAVAVCRMLMSKNALPRALANGLIKIMQGTPVVVVLMILYFLILGKLRLSGVLVAIIGFMILIAAECGELYYRSIRAVDIGQMEAGIAIGLTRKECYQHIIIPQAMVSIVPGYRNLFISLLKGTAIVGYIAVEDLTKVSDIIKGRTYDAFFPLITTALIYFLLSCLTAALFRQIGKRFDPRFRKRGVKGVKTHA